MAQSPSTPGTLTTSMPSMACTTMMRMMALVFMVARAVRAGVFLPVSPTSPPDSGHLRGVPLELRDKILAFHRQLDSPDTFPRAAAAAPRTQAAGLAEWTKQDELDRRREEQEVKGELQTDLFRFSSKVSIPHAEHLGLQPTNHPSKDNFIHFLKKQARLRERIRKEWKRFMKWRTQKRKRKKLKKRINRRLNKQLRKKFGFLKIKGKRTKEEIMAFRKGKRRLKKQIARRLRFKRMERRKKGVGEGEVRGERQEKGKRRRTEVKPLKPRKQRKLRPPRKRRRNRKKT